jgi:predicted nucleic acid-binding Zn ribbon protein
MKKKKDLTSVSDVLQGLLENSKLPISEQFTRWKLWRKWEEVVGPTLAPHTLPVSFQRGTLYIWVKSSAWMQQLSFAAVPLKAKINEYLGREYVRFIRFTLDKHSVPNIGEGDLPDFEKPGNDESR